MKNKELKVGLFSAITLVMLYFGFNYLKGIDFFVSKKIYYAIYDNIDQLAVSNPVLVNGYAVGRVSRIKILQNINPLYCEMSSLKFLTIRNGCPIGKFLLLTTKG